MINVDNKDLIGERKKTVQKANSFKSTRYKIVSLGKDSAILRKSRTTSLLEDSSSQENNPVQGKFRVVVGLSVILLSVILIPASGVDARRISDYFGNNRERRNQSRSREDNNSSSTFDQRNDNPNPEPAVNTQENVTPTPVATVSAPEPTNASTVAKPSATAPQAPVQIPLEPSLQERSSALSVAAVVDSLSSKYSYGTLDPQVTTALKLTGIGALSIGGLVLILQGVTLPAYSKKPSYTNLSFARS